jgi:hypothetical protein
MAEGETVAREALFQEICQIWQRTEDAIAALGEHFEAPCSGDWTIGDAFRHLTAASHIMPGRIRALLATGELPFPGDDGNAEWVEKFRALDDKMLRIELNTAHGVVWMYIQRFSDEDLAQTFTIFDEEHTLAQVIRQRVLHETWHVNEALEALGLEESVIVPVETAHRWT